MCAHRAFVATALLLSASCLPAAAQVATFDTAANVLQIPAVAVGADTFRNVQLQHLGQLRFSLLAATPQSPPGAADARFDARSGLLQLPAVKVGEQTYVDVRLLADASLNFSIAAGKPLPADVSDAVRAFAASYDALFASAVPASGAARYSLHDPCWLSDGRTRAWSVADFDADLADRLDADAYQVGRITRNLQVLALRDTVAADGSSRQEVDVQWDVAFKDGSTQAGLRSTLVRGSTAGVPGCASPTRGDSFRLFGNRQLVQTAVRSRNLRDERHALAGGGAQTPAVNFRRSVQFQVSDPLGNATYVIVTGPGPAGTVNDKGVPFSLKLISPRLLRSAPELAGRTGAYVNWRDDDSFRYCRVASGGVPVAALADCTTQGAIAFDWGISSSAPGTAEDRAFDSLGFVAQGAYRFDVYNDDGWKTVNGHAGRTPVATYHAELAQLPFSFVDMAGTGGAGRYPRLSFAGATLAQVAATVGSAQAQTLAVTWAAPVAAAGWPAMRLVQAWTFHDGPRSGNAANAFYPAYRTLGDLHPASAATTAPQWPVPGLVTGQSAKTYLELALLYGDRGTRQLISLVSFY